MDKSVKRFKQRRAERLAEKRPVRTDAVEEYRERRNNRLKVRLDAGQGWVFGALKSKGIDTAGMDLGEAFDKWNEISKGNGNKSKKAETKSNNKGGPLNVNIPKATVEHDGSKYNGKPGEVKSGKNGNLKPKSDKAKRIDTRDAIEETRKAKETGKGLTENSLTKHIDENGNLSPERQKVHDEIVQSFFADKIPYNGKPTMIMSGGGPASGKSFISKNAKAKFGEETVAKIDPDDVKAMLPGYAEMARKTKEAAGYYHEESSALAKRLYQYAADNGINVVYDGTGDGSVGSVVSKLKVAQEAGYNIKGSYVTVDTEEALRRNQKRYEKMLKDYQSGKSDIPPRLPPEDDVKRIHSKVTDISLDVAGIFDDWELTDNNVKEGEERPVIARCKKGGEIEIVPGMEERVQNFLNKGKTGAKVVNGRIVRPDDRDKK